MQKIVLGIVASSGILSVLFGHSFVYAAVTTDGMVGYWKFDETSTGTATDASGHGNNGTHVTGSSFDVSTTVPTTSFSNTRSLSFDDDYVSIPDDASLDVSNITISFWTKMDGGIQEDGAGFVCKGDGSGGEVWCIDVSGSNYRFFFWSGGVAYPSTSTTSFNTDWTHVAATYDGTTSRIYINGTQEDSDAHSVALDTNNHVVSIGSRQSAGAGYDYNVDGLIDDVRIYNRALSATEIGELANGDHTTATWDGSSNTNYETAANWDINAVPDPYTHIIIPESYDGAELRASVSGASLTIEANGLTGTYLDLHGYNFELTDGGSLKGGGTLRLIGSETTNINNVSSTSTGTVLYYGTGSYSGFATGDSYYNLNINDGLVGYWDFDASEGGYVRDVSGYDADGVRATSPAAPSFVSTAAPTSFFNRYALSFDGNDRVDLDNPSPFRLSQIQGTAAVWVKTDNPSSDQIIFWTEENRDRGLIIDGDDSAFAGVIYDGNISRFRVASGSTVTTGWHHVAYTWDINQGSVRLFVDGRAVDSSSGSAWTTNGNDNRSGIGEYIGAGDFTSDYNNFDGLLDDFRIYKRVLQDYEISALAAGHTPATGSGTYTLDAALSIANNLSIAGGDLDVSGSNYSITLSGSWLNYGGQFSPRNGTVTFDGSGVSDEELRSGGQAFTNLSFTNSSTWTLRDLLDTNGALTLSSGTLSGSYTMYAYDIDQTGGSFSDSRSSPIVLDGSADATSTITSTLNELHREDPTENGLLGYWKFDECQGNQLADSSGNAETATFHGQPIWTGTTLPSTEFQDPCALDFDGTDDGVTTPVDLSGVTAFTLAGWVYPRSAGSRIGFFGQNTVAEFGFLNSSRIDVFTQSGGTAAWVFTSGTFPFNTWHHVAVTGDGEALKIFVDGSVVTTGGTTIDGTYGVSASTDVNIGYAVWDTANNYFNGAIDDVRVYNRALTTAEVQNLASGYYAEGVQSTSTITLGGNLDIGTLSIFSGKVSAGSNTIDVSSDWNNYAGTGAFAAGTSTVDLDGSSTQNVRGSTNFYNLEISTSAAQTVNFGSGTTQGASNTITLTGQSSNLLTLAPLSSGYEWFLDVGGSATQSVSYVSVSYSNASPGEAVQAYNGTNTDGSNNTNWQFSSSSSSSSSSTTNSTSSSTVTTQPSGGGRGRSGPGARNADALAVREALYARYREQLHNDTLFTAAPEKEEDIPTPLDPNFAEQRRLYRITQLEKESTAERSGIGGPELTQTVFQIADRRGLLAATVKQQEVLFKDVPTDSWFAPYVALLIEEEIATGYEDETGEPKGEFGVENPVTLAEILKMALEAAETILSGGSPRNTSAKGTWASSYVATAEGLLMRVFTPDRNVHEAATRGEVIQTVLEAFDIPVQTGRPFTEFTDLPEDHPFADAIAVAYFYGIIDGDTDSSGNPLGTVRPDDPINRAEAAKLIAILKELRK